MLILPLFKRHLIHKLRIFLFKLIWFLQVCVLFSFLKEKACLTFESTFLRISFSTFKQFSLKTERVLQQSCNVHLHTLVSPSLLLNLFFLFYQSRFLSLLVLTANHLWCLETWIAQIMLLCTNNTEFEQPAGATWHQIWWVDVNMHTASRMHISDIIFPQESELQCVVRNRLKPPVINYLPLSNTLMRFCWSLTELMPKLLTLLASVNFGLNV